MFEIGDRVRLVDCDIDNDMNYYLRLGMTGTVVAFDKDDGRPGVSWDYWSEGHTCGGRLTNSSGWYVSAEALEPLDTVPMPDPPTLEDIAGLLK